MFACIVPELNPFSGLRYDASALSRLAAPPYDVIDEDQRVRLEALDPHNAVRLILPRDSDGEDRYAVAASTLRAWIADGTLRRDVAPSFTVVRMRFDDPGGGTRTTVGVIGALALPDHDRPGGILPHERTLPKAKSDRLALLRATRANLDPIWGLSLTDGLTDHLLPDGPPDVGCADDAGAQHEAWVVADPERVAAITAAVGRSPLVLADGHHRFETALRYREERAGNDDAGARAIMALVVELAEDQLCIQPIHRLLHLPPGLDARAALAESFDVVDIEGAPDGDALAERARAVGALGLADHRGAALLEPREQARRATQAQWPHPVSATDAALVESAVRPRLEGAEWKYRAGAATVVDAVRSGTADAALLLRAVSVAETRAVAEADARMPQKTTFFHPKPRTGFVFRTLD